MKSVSRTMYTIGRVINAIEIIGAIFLLVAGILTVAMPGTIAEEAARQGVTALATPQKARACGIAVIISASISFVVALVIFILARKATKQLNESEKSTTPHTIMLVIGIFGDIFYFLGGLFGILGINEPTQDAE
ncbi:MAG: hypothetical protein IJ817_02280 [Clostridia bacterium]|nr:hypothetical protein [Clostridia bacterium]